MVKAPADPAPNKYPLSNVIHQSAAAEVAVAIDSDREVVNVNACTTSDNLLETENTSNESNSYAASSNNDTHNRTYQHNMTTTSAIAEELLTSEVFDYTTSNSVEINGNNIDSANISSPKNEQSTQTDDDDNSSNCSSKHSIRYLVIDRDEEDEELQNNIGGEEIQGTIIGEEVIEHLNLDNEDDKSVLVPDDIDSTNQNYSKNSEQIENSAQINDEIEEETYCVGYFYGQDDGQPKPHSSEIENDIERQSIDDGRKNYCDNVKSMKTGLETVPEANETSETPIEENNLIENSNLPSTTISIPVPISATKPYNNLPNRSIPHIIGIPGIMAQQHSLPQPLHKQHQPQQSVGGLLQPLHLATLSAHSGGAVNQQISPTTSTGASALALSTAIQPHHHHHHHCVHHPHVHLHSPAGQQATNGGVVGTAPVGSAGHPHTHIFPLQVISLAQGPGTAAAAAGAAAAWPLVEAPIYVDANGEYRTYCPAHPQGPPPPREHRVLLQLDAGVSLPLQIAGKRKVFRGNDNIATMTTTDDAMRCDGRTDRRDELIDADAAADDDYDDDDGLQCMWLLHKLTD